MLGFACKPTGLGMVSTLPLLSERLAAAVERLRRGTPVLFENGGADMLLMTGNTHSGTVSQGLP
jgi:hypothetical protein